MGLKEEILEQPAVLRHLIDTQTPVVKAVAEEIQGRSIDTVFLTARGTSDNAGLYAKYLWGAHNGLPIALAAPSLFSIYRRPPRLNRTLVVGISQSGQSPDIVSVVEEGRRQGVLTLAITNAPDSPLAEASDYVLDVCAGPERAVAATKSYTAQLMAIALLSVAMEDAGVSPEEDRWATLRDVPDWVDAMLDLDADIRWMTERYRYMDQCVVLGRGYNYATAYEWALKLKELTYTVAGPYSSADFQHGPIAMVAQGFPVFAVAPDGAVFPHMLKLLKELKEKYQVELLALSNREKLLDIADTRVKLPASLPEWVSPLVSIVPAQLLCYHLTRAKGLSTETPRRLSKVTKTE
jgi:glucosamine--fructose-6-phosphate aminotransferase (isomerizing)